MSLVNSFDELSEFCLCLDRGGEVVLVRNDLSYSIVLSPLPVLLWMAYYGGSLI